MDGIVYFVLNSLFFSYMYKKGLNLVENDKGEMVMEYIFYKNFEGKMVVKNIEWYKENGIYIVFYIIGVIIVIVGIFILVGIWNVIVGLVGGLFIFGMLIVIFLFLIIILEVWVFNLGGDLLILVYGFFYFFGVGCLVIKDVIMMVGGLIVVVECVNCILVRKCEV